MKAIPLIVLVHEGPGARSYLAMMAKAGYRPSSIVIMVASHGESSGNGKKIGRLLPGFLRMKYASRVQELRRMYWPRQILKQQPELYSSIATGLSSIIDDSEAVLDAITGAFAYEQYSDDVERIMVRDYRDPELARMLSRKSSTPILYTGGGILPRSLVDSELRFVHVHPGNLPHIRGADGLLWSTLVRGMPGAACFYMNAGIDTGEIIETSDLPAVQFEIPDAERPDDQTLYRSIFSFYDPLMRAKFFSGVLSKYDGKLPESGLAQSTDDGVTYHFMHDELRSRALRRVFVSSI